MWIGKYLIKSDVQVVKTEFDRLLRKYQDPKKIAVIASKKCFIRYIYRLDISSLTLAAVS